MISFELTEEQSIAQSSLREFAAQVLTPAARSADDESVLADETLDTLWELGIVQSRVEADADGAIMSSLALEELAQGDASAAVAIASSLGFFVAIAEQGSAAQKEWILPLLSAPGFHAAGVLLAEPTAAFSATKLSMRAQKTSEGYILNGSKCFVPLAKRSSHFLVIADLGGDRAAFIVPSSAVGLEYLPSHGTLGLRALQAGDVAFKDVFVQFENMLGGPVGCDVDRIIDGSRVALAAILTGMSAAVRDYVVPYTKERIAHGEPLAKKQTIAFRIADMHMKVEGMRWMHWCAARAIDLRKDTTRQCRLAQVYANQHALWIADEGLQMLGGHGYTRDFPVEMWYRNARSLSVLDGVVGV